MLRSKRVLRQLGSVVLVVLVGIGGACKHIARRDDQPRARLLDFEEELSVVTSRLSPRARRVVTGSNTVPVGVHFDPDMLDASRVESYSVWALDGASGNWRRLVERKPEELPVELTFDDGDVGLRASAKYQGGEEVFVPKTGDSPVIWVMVDQVPPKVRWLTPKNDSVVGRARKRKVFLSWSVEDVAYGSEPHTVEWSADRGKTWRLITKVDPNERELRYHWKMPKSLRNDFIVRVVARDLVGNSNSAVISLQSSLRGKVPGSDSSSSAQGSVATVRSDSGVDGAQVQRAASSTGGALSTASAVTPAAGDPNSPLQLAPFNTDTLAGGSAVDVEWHARGLNPELDLYFEWKCAAEAEWALAGKSKIGATNFRWEVPPEDAFGCLFRLRTQNASGAPIVSVLSTPFDIDFSPPRISLDGFPDVLPGLAEVRFLATDLSSGGGEGSGLEQVRAFLRTDDEADWQELPAGNMTLRPHNGGEYELKMDLLNVQEGRYQLYLQGSDTVGNQGEVPHAESVAMASFVLDKTPPGVAMTLAPHPWVQGLQVDVQLDADWVDIQLPVVIDGRAVSTGAGASATRSDSNAGEWRELARWTRVSPGQRFFGWTVPIGSSEYQIRVVVQDAAGNAAEEVSKVRRVVSAIGFDRFDPATIRAPDTLVLAWKLHAAADAHAEEFRVSVGHQTIDEQGRESEWTPICGDLDVQSDCVWEVRAESSGLHRLRLQLYRQRRLASEFVTDAFSVSASRGPTNVVEGNGPARLTSSESMSFVEVARTHAAQYREAARAATGASTSTSSQELSKLAEQVTVSYQHALTLDANNAEAAYELAQFLNRLPERNEETVEGYLQQALKSQPNHPWALNDLGALYIYQERYPEAEGVLVRAVEAEPSGVILFNLGMALFYQEKMSNARSRFGQALKADGASRVPEGEVYWFLVQTHLQEGSTAEARALYRDKADLIPEQLREDLQRRL